MVFRKLISNRNEETEVKMKKPIYLGFSILDLSKIVMCEFWYDYIKPKYYGHRWLYYSY